MATKKQRIVRRKKAVRKTKRAMRGGKQCTTNSNCSTEKAMPSCYYNSNRQRIGSCGPKK